MADEKTEIIVESEKKLDKEKIKKIALIGGCAIVAAGAVILIAKSGSGNEVVEVAAQAVETVA